MIVQTGQFVKNPSSKTRDFPMKRFKFLCVIACILMAGSMLAGVPQAWGQTAASSTSQEPRLAAPEDRILVQTWAESEAVISSPIVGLIQYIPSRLGQRFEKGEPLLRFECTENEARAQIAQAELSGAQENLEAKIRLKSLEAASDLEVTLAAAQVAKAEGQHKLSQYQLTQCALPAPFSGFVVRIMGKPFQTTTVGQPLLEVISAGVPKLRVSASSRLFRRFAVGTALRVRIDETGQTYSAQVSLINARIDPVNQTFEMEARIDGAAPDLLPGMSGTAVIPALPRAPSTLARPRQ
jgi:RND family efflux transporter MFP subunit